jgi:methyl-accepting chemotaxis protein
MAAAVEELSVSIDHVGENAREAQGTAQRSGEQSRAGGQIVHAAADEMRVVAEAVNTSAGTIGELEGYSSEISTVVGVIKDIADQTNLLALNAAIEAARAGEQGRGFAVVADEVRKLAERTTQSTLQIGATIEKVQSGARQAVAAMEAGVQRVGEGVHTAQQAGDSIVDIQASARRVMDVVQDIVQSLKEQSTAAQDIAKGVERIAQMAEENSASVKQTAAAASDMQALAANLTTSVGRFKT